MPFPKRLNRLVAVWGPVQVSGEWVVRSSPRTGRMREIRVQGTRPEVEARARALFRESSKVHSVVVYQWPVVVSSVQVYSVRRESGGKTCVEISRRLPVEDLAP